MIEGNSLKITVNLLKSWDLNGGHYWVSVHLFKLQIMDAWMRVLQSYLGDSLAGSATQVCRFDELESTGLKRAIIQIPIRRH